MKIAVTGSSGFIGSALVPSLRADGHEVIRLVRGSPGAADEVHWDPRAADAGAPDLAGVAACVHLAGVGVMNRRWTARYKAEVRASRVLGTRALAGALAKLSPVPAVMVSASAVGWYGNTGATEVDESAPAGQGFLARVVRDWEAAADPARDAGIRVVHPRSGLVLGSGGGILAKMIPAARLGLCPRFGTGRQVVSWISLTDEIAAIKFLLTVATVHGPVNLTAPESVTNSVLTGTLAKTLGRPDLPWLRVPAPLIRAGLGEASSELLNSVKVAPRRLLDAGYEFRYRTLSAALAAELGR